MCHLAAINWRWLAINNVKHRERPKLSKYYYYLMELIWDSEDLKGSAVVFLRSNNYARILVKQARDEFKAKGACGKQKSQIVAALMRHHE